jgi:hypothetical protein
VRVHESVIASIIEAAGVTRSALYHELNARNVTVPGTSGASMNEWVDGTDERFWTLLPDLGTPRTYVPDPNTAVAATAGIVAPADEEQPAETGHTETGTSGDDDAQDDGDGFESVGETA